MAPDLLRVFLITLHIVVSLFLILVVLLQTGKGASLGAAFGGSSDTMFGARGAGSFLAKLTTGSAIVFILTSLSLAHPYFSNKEPGTVVREIAAPARPVTPRGSAQSRSEKRQPPGVPSERPSGGG